MLENFLREYNINRIFLSTTGLWPFQNKLVRIVLWTFCFLLEISYYPFAILLVYDHRDDAQLICEGFYQILIVTVFIIRYLTNFMNHDKIRWLCEAIDEHWNIFTNDMEVQIIKEYSILSRKFIKYYLILLCSSISVLLIMPLTPIFLDIIMPFNESRPRFFAVEVEFRVNKDDYFLSIFCYITAIIVVGIAIMMGLDTMHIVCTAHACSLFAAVSKQIKNIVLKVDNNKEINESKFNINKKLDLSNEEIIYRAYIKCLKKHQLAIEFVDMLNSLYQGYAFALLTIVVGVLSVVGLRIVYVLDQLDILVKLVPIFIISLFTVMIACYSGQRIMDESHNVFYGAYAAEWYRFSPRLKSLLIITLYRSNIPCSLKAGNMIPLSIATYAVVIRLSMSYYAALLSIQE